MTPVRALSIIAVLSLVASACAGSGAAVPVAEPDSTATSVNEARTSANDVPLPRLEDRPVTELISAASPADIELPTVQGPAASADQGRSNGDTPPTTRQAGTIPSTTAQTTTPVAAPNTQAPPSADPSPPTTVPQASTGPPPFPAAMAAIRGSEEILLIDTTTGNSTSIAKFSLLVDQENKIGPQFPFSVDVDPVAVGIRYDTCCDPQGSETTFVDLASGAPETANPGALPSVSPDGSKLALSDVESVDVVDVASGSTSTLARSGEQWFVGRTTWSPDGATIAVEVLASSLQAPAIALFEATMPNLDNAKVLEAPAGYAWTLPSFRYDGDLVVLETSISAGGAEPRVVVIDRNGTELSRIDLGGMDGVLDIDHDVSGYWLIVVDDTGGAFWFGPNNAGRLPGSGFTSASW